MVKKADATASNPPDLRYSKLHFKLESADTNTMSKIIDQKIGKIFEFLETHHHFNRSIQVDEIKYTHLNGASIEDKAIRLLWNIYFTQSQTRCCRIYILEA